MLPVNDNLIRQFIEPFLPYGTRVLLRPRDPSIHPKWLETCDEETPWPGLELDAMVDIGFCKLPDHWDEDMIEVAGFIWAHHTNPSFAEHATDVLKRAYPDLLTFEPTNEALVRIMQHSDHTVDIECHWRDGKHGAAFAAEDYCTLADMLSLTTIADRERISYTYNPRDVGGAATHECPVYEWFDLGGEILPLNINVSLTTNDLNLLIDRFLPTWQAVRTYTHDELLHILHELEIAARARPFEWQPYFQFSNFIPSADLVPENFYELLELIADARTAE